MQIEKDSSALARAQARAIRLNPQMFRMKLDYLSTGVALRRCVVGSSGNLYEVYIWLDNVSYFNASCECRAAFSDLVCYHIAAVWRDYQRAKIAKKVFSLRVLNCQFESRSPIH